MPIIGTGADGDARHAKHRDGLNAAGYRVTISDYGPENWCVALIRPTPTAAVHSQLISDPEVTAIPVDIDTEIDTNLSIVQSKLDAINVPSDWVSSTTTYRAVLNRLEKYFLFMQRVGAKAGDYITRLFDGGVTLNTTMGELNQATRQKLINAADDMGLDRSSVTLSTTVGQALRIIAEQI